MRNTIQATAMLGFSLVELMMVVVIVSILAIIAVPSYRSYVQESRRSAAINGLLAAQTKFELFYAQSNGSANSYPTSASNPTAASQLPGAPSTTYYTYSYVTSSNSYTITATAVSTQSQNTDKQGSLACNILSVNNLNERKPFGCWNQ